MGRVIVEQIVSADGYAHDEAGGIDFFENPARSGADGRDGAGGDDAGGPDMADGAAGPLDREQLEFVDQVDAIVLGRVTYGMFAGYWPTTDPAVEPVAAAIARLPKYVVSNTLDRAPWGDDELELLRGDGARSVAALRDRHDSIVVWGSLTLTDALFAAGLVDELRLRVVPVLIGGGRSFTPREIGSGRRLRLDHVRPFSTGHVTLQYRLA